jgi:hypothetical protein
MAQPPPIPEKPADRLETRQEYDRRRSAICLHRWFQDELGRMLRDPMDMRFLMKLYNVNPFRK